jgi:hypothetical protein
MLHFSPNNCKRNSFQTTEDQPSVRCADRGYSSLKKFRKRHWVLRGKTTTSLSAADIYRPLIYIMTVEGSPATSFWPPLQSYRPTGKSIATHAFMTIFHGSSPVNQKDPPTQPRFWIPIHRKVETDLNRTRVACWAAVKCRRDELDDVEDCSASYPEAHGSVVHR